MPPKKKKGKGNKLAKMSEEERLRYLAHRAEIELEAKRRKQQLIAAFTKNKLKREEAFSRLNNAKINEHWRFQLRQIKCKELYDEVEYLWKNFDHTLRIKNMIIKILFEDLEKADVNHRRLQEVHMTMIDELITRHQRSVEILHGNYIESVMVVKVDEIAEMNDASGGLLDNCRNLEVVSYMQNVCIDDKLLINRTRNSVNSYSIEYTKTESINEIRQTIGTKINDLWYELTKIVSNYQDLTREKWKSYLDLKIMDEEHKQETTNFPRLQSTLTSLIEFHRNQVNSLSETRNKQIFDLENELKLLKSKIFQLRDEISINQTLNKTQLKRLTVVSNKVIEYLKQTERKSHALKIMVNICTNLEPLLTVTSYSLAAPQILEEIEVNEEEEDKIEPDPVMERYEKLNKFWKQFNYVKADNFLRIKFYNQLLDENRRLKNSVRFYFGTINRSVVPRTPD